ncbi:glycoside hydrolase family 43 protein [Gilvimarinus sp. SDUM040013]|uniref:Glycoside hydrolase family 43 protein n=1 Tax=Gilvimarinus gilvus TaxID=3058038 RepID=A0ABU4RX42_9GAMM|nr:glycoside hydrolase family 43 protein [Gilvimarinus sp. SDUM040013]MDO3386817.1 glycoside hydrolase family 43 protein [Gilvimarinus sp. SDUM040013]MDX6848253.1 glycoside hydrolase family 43 protein [Gilvimarinus sp. SDUM040013]
MNKLFTLLLVGLAVLLAGCDSTPDSNQSEPEVSAQEVSSSASTPAAAGAAQYTSFSYKGKSQEQVVVGEGEFRNPVISGYAPDPTVTRVGDDYYVVTSSFTHFPGLPIYHSKDLVNWTHIANAIDRPDQFDFFGLNVSRGIFAPDISYHEGLYYLTSTCVDCDGNFVMTAESPTGPWSDPHWLGFEGIDPSIHWDTSGKAYILNNGAPNEEPRYDGHRAIWIQEFDWRNLAMTGERKQLINGGVDISEEPVWIEGPHIIQRNGYYYITAAEGGTSVQHSQTIFRADNVWGPYKPADHNPILTQRDLEFEREDPIIAAGHAKFVQIPNGDWWATFLAIRPYDHDMFNIGRETFLLPVRWENDWPYILPEGERIPFALKKPDLPVQPEAASLNSGDFSYSDDFDGDKLSLGWMGIRASDSPFYQVENGALNLACEGGLGDLNTVPSFVGKRQQHHIATVSTTVSLGSGDEGQMAGLAAIQNDQYLMFLGIREFEGEQQVALYRRAGSLEDELVKATTLPDTENVTLTLAFDGGQMSASYDVQGQSYTLAEAVDATNLSTNVAGGFVGTLIGPYCTTL